MSNVDLETAIDCWKRRLVSQTNTTRSKNETALYHIDKLSEWLLKKGWKLEFNWNQADTTDFGSKLVTISYSYSPRVAVYYLLHECGHILIGNKHKKFVENFGATYYAEEQDSKDVPQLYQLATVQEEMEAWSRGLRLAKRLKLGIDQNSYNDCRVKSLKTYVLWAVKSWDELKK